MLAVGHEAKNMINHTPDAFSAEHPLKDGVIADYDVTEAMISAFINKAAPRKYPWQAPDGRPRGTDSVNGHRCRQGKVSRRYIPGKGWYRWKDGGWEPENPDNPERRA